MKKLVSILMAMVLVLSLSVPAFAAENTGSITITNATVDETYRVYKIFDASISTGTDGKTDAVSYSITTDNQFFEALFGTDGTTANPCFAYNANTGTVTKKENVNDSDLIDYLTDLVEKGSYTVSAPETVAAGKEVKFENLPYGYYLVTSSLGTTVTINSNTPDVQVIDKNQKPGVDFDKEIQTGVDGEGKPTWGDSNTANIGDKVSYRITLEATNYDGDKQIQYYQFHDTKGNAIWVEFDSIKVFVNGTELKRGYYLDQGGNDNGNWEFFGDWTGVDKTRDNAEWYLVHLDEDNFRITVPWLTGHTLKDNTNAQGEVVSYSLTFADGATSKFASPAEVEIFYDAAIEANAEIGTTTRGNRYNQAYASWTSANETGSTSPETVVTYVYGIGILKDDIATGENLAGAKFRIYSDKDCTQPVYVIPTNVQGVYMVDSLKTPLATVTGDGKQDPRVLFAAYLAAYLGTGEQDNYVVTPINGKVAILGLKEGTYYLKEVEAPAGYNALTQPVELKAGTDVHPDTIFVDKNGNVADIQAADGIHTEYTLNLTSKTVHNSKGVVLPSTGGMGTFWLITIGTLLAIGFAVFLITHKKMSVYTD